MQLSYINIFVTELDRAIEFYGGVLGLPFQFSSPEHGYAAFSGGGVRLGLSLPGPDQREFVGRHTGIGFTVPDLEAEYARLLAQGVEFTLPPTRQPWGGFISLAADPDGNLFYLDEASAAQG